MIEFPGLLSPALQTPCVDGMCAVPLPDWIAIQAFLVSDSGDERSASPPETARIVLIDSHTSHLRFCLRQRQPQPFLSIRIVARDDVRAEWIEDELGPRSITS